MKSSPEASPLERRQWEWALRPFRYWEPRAINVHRVFEFKWRHVTARWERGNRVGPPRPRRSAS